MRTKILSFVLMAGTVVGCGSNPPPPPPMAAAPEPMPMAAPAPMGPMAGRYTGTADMNADMPRGCAKMTRPMTAIVRGTTVSFAGVRGMIGPDGAVMSRGRGAKLSGMATAAGMDVTLMKGKCTYHYMLTKA